MTKIVYALIFLILGSSCANPIKKQVEQEKKQVRPFFTREAVIDRATEIVEDAKGLTEEQKEKFIELQGDMWVKVHEMNDEIKALKIVMFKNLVSENYSELKTQEIIKQIRAAHNKKLQLMLDALKKSRLILGREVRHINFLNFFKNNDSSSRY